MFWKMAGLSTTSPIDSILDRSVYTLEELLDEDRLIQECKASNSRLINFLQEKSQVLQMIHYIIDEAPEGADSKRAFKYPFVSCQVFTCEIQSILKTVVENEEILHLLFSFLEPDWPHGTLLSGYFSKVVISLLVWENSAVVQYFQQVHDDILKKIVSLLGVTSIKEVLMRLVGADEHIRNYHGESSEWLCNTNLLEMVVDKLKPENSPEDHANAAEILCAVAQTAPSGLASQLASASFVTKLLDHALTIPKSKSALVHSLSVCISLLDRKKGLPRQSLPTPMYVPAANPEAVETMLHRLGDLLLLLDMSHDENRLPTTYGELRPPFGIHRLKIVEFIAVLLKTNSEAARQELIKQQALQLVIDFFFDFPFNNMLHSLLEAIVTSCIENGYTLIDTLFVDCDFVSKLLAANDNPRAPDTRPTAGTKVPPRIGNLGHLTRIANKLAQDASTNLRIRNYLQSHSRWNHWQTTVLQQRNMLENVQHWTCGRPTAIRDRPAESDDDEFRERDYDVSLMANNMTEVFRSGMYDTEEAEEIPGTMERDEEDQFFDDETAQAVIRSIRLGDEQERLNSPAWFAFSEDNFGLSARDDNGEASPSSGSDEDVAGDEDNNLGDTATSSNGTSRADNRGVAVATEDLADTSGFNLDYFSSKSDDDWANFHDYELPESRKEDFGENNPFTANFDPTRVLSAAAATNTDEGVAMEEQTETKAPDMTMLPEASEEIVGVETEGTAKAMENALKEGIVGEASPLKPKPTSVEEREPVENKAEAQEFNDVNYWRSGYEGAVIEEQS